MITQEQYDKTNFCKKWAKTPQEAKKKLLDRLKCAREDYLKNPTEINLDNIHQTKEYLQEIES